MYHRLEYIESRRTLADSGTLTDNINVVDPISVLFLEMRATNGSTSNKANFVADCLARFELIDGGNVLLSLTGHELAGLYWQQADVMGYQVVTEVPGTVANLYVPIMFGRWVGDPSLALDPKKFKNLQYRVTWDLAAVRAVGTTGFATGTAVLTLLAYTNEGGGAPVGFLRAKEEYSFTTAASGVERVELPTDAPIRSLLVRVHKAGAAINSNISNVKIAADGGKLVTFDGRMTDFVRMNPRMNRPIAYKHELYAASGDTLSFIPKQDEIVTINPASTDSVAAYANNGLGQGTLTLYTAGSADSNNRNLMAHVQGWCPFGCVLHTFGDWDDVNDWLPARGFDSLRLELTQANAGATVGVVVQSGYSY
jgi:hypothetical protein